MRNMRFEQDDQITDYLDYMVKSEKSRRADTYKFVDVFHEKVSTEQKLPPLEFGMEPVVVADLDSNVGV